MQPPLRHWTHSSFTLMAPLRLLNSFSVILPLLPFLPVLPLPLSSASIPPQMAPIQSVTQEPRYRTNLLAPILSNLGFQELSLAVPALYSPVLSSWTGPVTLFAPSDDSIRSCPSCSAPRLLREHLVPGLFSRDYLSKLAFGTKLETAAPGRCLTITSTNSVSQSNTSVGTDPSNVKIFVDGVEITRANLFNNGQIVIHGIHGFVSPLSDASCSQEPFPSFSHEVHATHSSDTVNRHSMAIMRLMLGDAIHRLRESGYSILALAMRVKHEELASLHNMTVFALDDSAIFAGGHGYLTDVRFHIVPNRILMQSDLISMRHGMVVSTLLQGHNLVVTQAASGLFARSVRINYVPIKGFNVLHNSKIVVHSIFLPFPHLYLADLAPTFTNEGVVPDGSSTIRPAFAAGSGTCGDPNAVNAGHCLGTPASAPTLSGVTDFHKVA